MIVRFGIPLVELEDFDEEFDDLDCEEEPDNSMTAEMNLGDTTVDLVNNVELEQGIRQRQRSPSPEGSASHFSDSESVKSKRASNLRKVKDGRVQKTDNSIANIAVEALLKLAKVKPSTSKTSNNQDSDDSDNGQDPIMVKFDNYKMMGLANLI